MTLIRRTDAERSMSPSSVLDPFRMMDQLLRWDRDPFIDLGVHAPVATFAPDFELRETKDGWLISADVPGMAEEALELSVEGSTLTIAGRREQQRYEDGERMHVVERRYGAFMRSFALPESADCDKIEAELSQGVLQIKVAKKAEHKPRRIWLNKLLPTRDRPSKAA